MNLESLAKLSKQEKIKILNDLIKNDTNYWQKILILTSTIDEGDSKLIDRIVENKIKEIELFESMYCNELDENYYINDIKNTLLNRDVSRVMKNLVENNSNNIYAKACKEVLELLKYIPSQYVIMINPNFLERLQKNADNEYKFEINSKKCFRDIKFLEETKDLLSLINIKFWSNSSNKMDKILKDN